VQGQLNPPIGGTVPVGGAPLEVVLIAPPDFPHCVHTFVHFLLIDFLPSDMLYKIFKLIIYIYNVKENMKKYHNFYKNIGFYRLLNPQKPLVFMA